MYIQFVKAMRTDIEFQKHLDKQGIKRNFLQEVSIRWKDLTPEEKQPYENEYRR